MPGLSGFVSNNKAILDPRGLLDKFERVHQLSGVSFYSESFSSSEAVVLNLLTGLLRSRDYDPNRRGNGVLHIFVEGEVFDLAEVAQDMGCKKKSSAMDQIAYLYDNLGTALSSTLNGEFNIVIFDSNSRKLTIFADHLSTQPLFYRQSTDGLYFGSEKKSILAVLPEKPEIDAVGLLQGFRHIHNIGDRTFIKDLHRLRPGGVLEYKNGNLRIHQQPLVQFDDRRTRASADELIEEWKLRLTSAIRRRVKAERKIVVSLSGGLDSRAVIAAVPRDYRPLWARTRGTESSAEMRFAKLVAEQLGVEHFAEEPSDFSIFDYLDRIVWRTEGETTFLHGLTILNHATIKRHGDFLAGGYFGDAASGAHVDPRMFLPGSLESFAARLFEWYDCNQPIERLALVFNEEFLRKYIPGVRDEFVQSHLAVRQARNIDTHQVWNFYNRQTRMTMAAAPIDSHLFQRISPFYDRELVEFATTIPLRFRIGQVLYKKMIYDIGPELRDIPSSNSLRTLKGGLSKNRVDYAKDIGSKLKSRLGKKIGLSLSKSAPGRRTENTGDLIRTDDRFRTMLTEFCESEYFDEEIFNRRGIQELLRRHYQGEEDCSRVLGQLATFAVALPIFVYNTTPSCPAVAAP